MLKGAILNKLEAVVKSYWDSRSRAVALLASVVLAACGDDGNDNTLNIPDASTPADMGNAPDMDDFADVIDVGEVRDMNPDIVEMVRPRIAVEPATALLKVATGDQLEATYFDEDGIEVPDVEFTWSSANEDVATVDADGFVLGVSHGQSRVSATHAEEPDISGISTVAVVAPAVDLAAGRAHTCVTNAQEWTYCSGDNAFKQLAREDPLPTTISQRVRPLPEDTSLTRLLSGQNHVCGAGGDSVFCWGRNQFGQLSNSLDNSTSAVPVLSTLQAPVRRLQGEADISCALLDDGRLFCAGDNTTRMIADNDEAAYPAFSRVQSGLTFLDVAVGTSHICGITQEFDIFCWGDDSLSQLGPDATESGYTPVEIPGGPFTTIWAGKDANCAENFFNELYCWGSSPATFDGIIQESDQPIQVPFMAEEDVLAVDFMDEAICASRASGTSCWGKNDASQLADGTNDDRFTPAAIVNSGIYRQLECGSAHCCGLISAGDVFCWGANGQGQLSDGTSTNRRRPTLFFPATR